LKIHRRSDNMVKAKNQPTQKGAIELANIDRPLKDSYLRKDLLVVVKCNLFRYALNTEGQHGGPKQEALQELA
jgi:hypothetical protein